MPVAKSTLAILAVAASLLGACAFDEPKPYGIERTVSLPNNSRQVWAVAPVVNLSGVADVDPILQADLVYQQLQSVRGLTVIPVNRTVEVFVAMRIDAVRSPEEARAVAAALGADGLIIPTVSIYHPYDPPRVAASLQFIPRERRGAGLVDPRSVSRQASPGDIASNNAGLLQAVGMFDAANGSTRQALLDYAHGRNEPAGPLGAREYLLSIDRFSSFVYFSLIEQLLESAAPGNNAAAAAPARRAPSLRSASLDTER